MLEDRRATLIQVSQESGVESIVFFFNNFARIWFKNLQVYQMIKKTNVLFFWFFFAVLKYKSYYQY